MRTKHESPHKPVILTFRFLVTAVVGSLIMALVYIFAGLSDQIAVLGAYLSILGGLFISYLEQEKQRDRQRNLLLGGLSLPLELARDSEVFQEYEEMIRNIAETLKFDDALFRGLALEKLGAINREIKALSEGSIEYHETETWRTTYEQILRNPTITLYRSVALVGTERYWQDEPGKQSIALNYELQESQGLNIERIAIVADAIWPIDSPLPSSPIREWVLDQYNHGIWFELVRLSDLSKESELIGDFGVYGERAVGRQFLNDSSETDKFVLSFHEEDIRNALRQWEKLKLYSISVREILDKP